MNDEAASELQILFPTLASSADASLEVTDPEFVAFYDDFAFAETLRHVALDRRDRIAFQLAATVAVGALSEFRLLLNAALEIGVTPVQVKELIYQAVAYVGMARVVDFLHVTNDVFIQRGIPLPLEGQSTTSSQTRMSDGLAKQKQIFGAEGVDAMYSTAGDAVRFQEFLSGNCFGDYYTRTGFDAKQRELITFALLAALGGADNQVRAHVAGNLAVGNSRGDLLDILTVLVAYIGYPRTLNALAQVNAAAPASSE